MIKRIMVAVDLMREELAAPALSAAAKLATLDGSEVHYVSIRPEDSDEPAAVFRKRLETFTQAQQKKTGLPGGWLAIVDDPVDDGLANAVEQLGVDLVVMGPHEPRWHELLTGPEVRDFVANCKVSVLIAR